MTKICHRLVAETAKGIAAEVYEVLASNNNFYKTYPKQRDFIAKQWKYFIGDARKSLATMLKPKSNSDPTNPEYYYSQHIRDEIFEALLYEGEMKSAPPLDLNKLREEVGMEPLSKALPGLN